MNKFTVIFVIWPFAITVCSLYSLQTAKFLQSYLCYLCFLTSHFSIAGSIWPVCCTEISLTKVTPNLHIAKFKNSSLSSLLFDPPTPSSNQCCGPRADATLTSSVFLQVFFPVTGSPSSVSSTSSSSSSGPNIIGWNQDCVLDLLSLHSLLADVPLVKILITEDFQSG